MILKYYEAAKIDLDKNKLILFYGKNEGLKNEEISKIIKKNHEYEKLKYDEKEILENLDNFFNILLSQSLFGERKIIIINRSTDKFLKIINEIIDREIREGQNNRLPRTDRHKSTDTKRHRDGSGC